MGALPEFRACAAAFSEIRYRMEVDRHRPRWLTFVGISSPHYVARLLESRLLLFPAFSLLLDVVPGGRTWFTAVGAAEEGVRRESGPVTVLYDGEPPPQQTPNSSSTTGHS